MTSIKIYRSQVDDCYSFCVFVKNYISYRIIQSAATSKIIKFDTMLKENFGFGIKYFFNIVSNNIIIKQYRDFCIIEINTATKIRGNNICAICRLIDVGNRSIIGSNIISKIFDSVNKNIDSIYLLYCLQD